MAYKLNPEFKDELKHFGKHNWDECFHCGNCTAICQLTETHITFPRKDMRYVQMGLTEKLDTSLEPWLCYYCGECTETCPRDANPGEMMMSLRRYLTTRYDWTGISRLLYRSLPASIFAYVVLIAAVIVFAAFKSFNIEEIMHAGYYFEMFAIGGVFTIILIPNIIRMWYKTIIKPGHKVKLKSYFTQFIDFLVHMFTQKRSLSCDDSQTRWFMHFVLVLAYLSLLFTTVFLDWFGTESQSVIILGYVESAAVFIITFLFIMTRIRKTQEASKHSHSSDWFFVIWLFMMAISAFAVRLFIDMGMMENILWLYLIHLTVLAQWALIIVPFGKWTHFLYRSFAIYFSNLKMKELKNQELTKPNLATA